MADSGKKVSTEERSFPKTGIFAPRQAGNTRPYLSGTIKVFLIGETWIADAAEDMIE